MDTKIFHVYDAALGARDIKAAADIILRGGVVAIPTETVYGLGANALDGAAVGKIFAAKGRPQDNPLILHVPGPGWLDRFCSAIPDSAYALAERFWPGPLTMILRHNGLVPSVTTAGLPTAGMRCPRSEVTRALIEQAGVPIAAPSANISGRPSTTSFEHVLRDMYGKIDAIIDGGDCSVGLESTIIDLTLPTPRLLRPGGVTLEQLRGALGEVEVDAALQRLLGEGEAPRAPGMKYRHYAPRAPVVAVCGEPEATAEYIAGHADASTGVLCFDEFMPMFSGTVVGYGASGDLAAQAERLFGALRAFDDTDVTDILAQCPSDDGLGLAIANRLKKAAGFGVVEV